jgi:hypothetical protein
MPKFQRCALECPKRTHSRGYCCFRWFLTRLVRERIVAQFEPPSLPFRGSGVGRSGSETDRPFAGEHRILYSRFQMPRFDLWMFGSGMFGRRRFLLAADTVS